jgi:methionyl-tRNA formyltransferase
MDPMLLCLATEKGHQALQECVRQRPHRQFYICTFKELHVMESYDQRILETAAAAGIPAVSWGEFRPDPVAFLAARRIRAILCIGWRYLVPAPAVRHLNGEVIIAHDSLLPRLRGFAPLPTALITGEARTGVTFLRAGPGVDDGDVLWQGSVAIEPGDTIARLIERVAPLYREGVRRYLAGELREARAQDESQATYSIWRDEIDYRIDWSESAERVERTVRALGPPYLGARSRLGTPDVVIHQARVERDLTFAIRQPGKIWALDDQGRPTVVCGSGLLKVLAASTGGESILPVKSLRQRFT